MPALRVAALVLACWAGRPALRPRRALDDPGDAEPPVPVWAAVPRVAVDPDPDPSLAEERGVSVGVVTVGVFTGEVGSDGVLTEGVVTDGVVTCGTVTVPMLTDGTVTEGTVTVGTVTVGTDTVGTPSDGALPSAAAVGGVADTTSAAHPASTVMRERFIGPHSRSGASLTRREKTP